MRAELDHARQWAGAARTPVLLDPGPSRWFFLTTPPKGEARAQAWLARQGIYSFFPVERRLRYLRRRGRKIRFLADAPILPRYLIARFPGAPRWHVLKASPLIAGVIGQNGTPAEIRFAEIRAMHGLRKRAAAIDLRIAERAAKRLVYAPGDSARITEGPLAGFVVEIAEAEEDFARVKFKLLGKGEINISLASLMKLETGPTARSAEST